MRLIVLIFAVISASTFAIDGIGPATIEVIAQPNYGPERIGTVTIAGQTYTVTQASGCVWQLNSSSVAFDMAGGPGAVGVLPSDSLCGWTTVSNAGWIVLKSVTVATVNFVVSKNNGKPARSGTMTIAGQTFTVNQAGRK